MEIVNDNTSRTIKLNVFLVRHAETDYNKLGLIQGQLDTKLSSKGIEQAKCLGHHLKNVNFRYIFSSDLERAVKTADEVLALNVNKHSLKRVINEKLLRERRFGEAEGKHKNFLAEQAEKSSIHPQSYVPNGAETNEELVLRWKQFLVKLCKKLILEHLLYDIKSNDLEFGNINPLNLEEIKQLFLFDVNHNSNEIHQTHKFSIKESHQNDVLIMTHGAFMKRIVKHLIKETNCVYDQAHLEFIDKSIPNTSITNFEIEIDTRDSNLIKSFASSVKNFSNSNTDNDLNDREFHLLNHIKVKCNYINQSSHVYSG